MLEYRNKPFDVVAEPDLSEPPYDRVVKGIRRQARTRLSYVMFPIKVAIDADDHVMKAA